MSIEKQLTIHALESYAAIKINKRDRWEVERKQERQNMYNIFQDKLLNEKTKEL